jgi:eukaryotic-like serine/threonine-protein kinase
MTSLSTSRTTGQDGDERPSLPPSVQIGGVIAGKYRVDRIRGVGGMGIVVEAMHLHLDLPIAIKFMSPWLKDNPGGVVRFMLEARATARIQCEHVVRVFDVASLEDGTPYIVMECLEGEDLGRMLQKRGRLPVAEAVEYVHQACAGVAEAHTMGVVHRDLKPSNLFRCCRPHGAPVVKVLDFGVSKLLPQGDTRLRSARTTGPHVIIGSPAYSSPEQLYGAGNVDGRADIWALGAVLYELVTGKPPFLGDTLMEVCSRVVAAPLEPLGARSPEVSPELEAVIARSLAKDREQRFATVSDFAAALAPFALGRTQISVSSAPSLAAPTPARATGRRRRVSRSRAVMWCITSAVLAASLAAWASTAPRMRSPQRLASSTVQLALVTAPSFTRPWEIPPPETSAETDDAPVVPPIPATTAAQHPDARRWPLLPPDARLRPPKVAAPVTATR